MWTGKGDILGKLDQRGYTLIELVVVIAILSLIAVVAIPRVVGYTQKAKAEVCKTNCLQLERMYRIYLIQRDIDDSDAIFEQFLKDYDNQICPSGGEIDYLEGDVRCSVHGEAESEEDDGDGSGVPFL